ncbi:ABC transporter permease [Alteromonas oceanisediminis]|uniref:ABC transporter permease n=1 Tax=Alteromonas oceanisediminis TaxID=2836180 RepID=UPI001BDADFD3|nr:ABC transporter permease [Alteromonas oceanisediminis]MBT0585704.1 ABC transporter permease [Alteromonas oceanisediminis]
MVAVILSLLRKQAKHDALQVIWVILAIMLGCAGLSSVLILNDAARSDYQNVASHPLAKLVQQQPSLSILGEISKTALPLTRDDYHLLRMRGLTHAIALSKTTLPVSSDSNASAVTLYGIDAPALASLVQPQRLGALDPLGLLTSGVATHRDVILAIEHYAYANTNAEVTPLQIIENSHPQTRDAQPMGLLDMHAYFALFQANSVEVPLRVVLVSFDMQSAAQDTLIRQVKAQLPPDYQLTEWSAPIDAVAVTQSFHLNLLAMAMVMFVVCLFIVINALNLLIAGRLTLYRTLRQLGVGRLVLVKCTLIELLVYCLIATTIGVIAGHFIAVLLAPTLSLTLAGLFNIDIGLTQIDGLPLFLPVLLVTLLATAASAIMPLRQLTQHLSRRQYFSESTFNGTSTRANRPHLLLFTALVLAAVTFTLVMMGQSLPVVFVAIASLLLTGIVSLFWLYPRVLTRLQKCTRSCHPLMQWSVAHARQIGFKTKLASAAFFIALATHIGMNLMVDSFRTATLHWLDSRLVASDYVYGDKDSLVELHRYLSQQNRDSILRYRVEAEITPSPLPQSSQQSGPIRVYSYPTNAEYRRALADSALTDENWALFESGQGLLVNQQYAIRSQLNAGDDVVVTINEVSTTFRIAGIYMDYGNPFAQAMLPLSAFVSSQSAASGLIRLAEADISVMATALSGTDIQLPDTVTHYSRDEILALSLQAFDRTFVITHALNIVTLLVAVFSLTTSILLLERDNRHVSGLLRSLGVRQWQLTASLFSQYGLLCVVTALWATPFGVILAWLLTHKVNLFAFQWQFPLVLSASQIAQAIVISLAIVCLLSLVPILRGQRYSIRERLQCND